MSDIWFAVASISAFYLFTVAALLYRKYKAERYLELLRSNVRLAQQVDEREGLESAWRWREVGRVSYEAMLWQFWRPLDSFYPRNPARRIRDE